MTAQLLTGGPVADAVRAEIAARVATRRDRPRLAVLTGTTDEASGWYVRSIARAAERVGVACDVVELGPRAGSREIRERLAELGGDPTVSGVMLQTPLPGTVRLPDVADAIPPAKDVDGANPWSLGRLAAGLPAFAPATAAAVVVLLEHYRVPLAGRRVVVVGRSTVVGKPLAMLLLARDATVTVCHSRTVPLAEATRTADVLIVAAGRAGLIGRDEVPAGAVVVDVGTNPTGDGGLAGDVDPAVAAVASALSPVPGGVGPVTTAVLLRHTVAAAEQAAGGNAAAAA